MPYTLLRLLLPALLLFAGSPLHAARRHSTTAAYVAVSGGGHLYYEAQGRGEPLLLLHGHSLDRRMWQPQLRALSRRYRVVCPDFRGYGRSSDQREDLPMTHADDIITLMDSLHIDRAHVVGLSMGAFVAGDLLAMHPERLLSCTLVSGGIRRSSPGPSEPMDSAERSRRDQEIAALRQEGVDAYKRRWHEQLMASGGSQRERMRQPLWQMISDWSAWQALHKEVRLFYGREAWQELCRRGKTKVPTLVVRGQNDVRQPDRRPAELDYVVEGRYEVLPDCGHMLNMEQPRAFNRLLLRFLRSVRREL